MWRAWISSAKGTRTAAGRHPLDPLARRKSPKPMGLTSQAPTRLNDNLPETQKIVHRARAKGYLTGPLHSSGGEPVRDTREHARSPSGPSERRFPTPSGAFSGARHRAGWQLCDVCCNLTWLGQPDLVPVVEDVLHSTSELPQPEWLAQDKGVQHERADQ